MKAVQVDERDAGWEGSDPTFKVILYAPMGTWAVDTWDLSDCGVLEAIRWAQDNVEHGGAWAVGVHVVRPFPGDPDGEAGFIYLDGYDPNTEVRGRSSWEQRQVDLMMRRGTARVVTDGPR